MAFSTSGPATGGDIACYRGDTFERWVRFRRNGVEEHLTLSAFKMQIRNGGTLIKEISTTSPAHTGDIKAEVLGGGVLILTIPATAMELLPSGSFVYDIQQTYPDDKVKTRLRGSFTITDDITKLIS